ncbi:MAG TPA: hypothetical protein VNT22_00075 [Baekduia sp.]|nr:hypothetical protein [Baekduia sp.]
MNERDLARKRAEERRPVEEAGGGVSEGFEQSEELLIEHTSHGDQHAARKIIRDANGLDEEERAVDDDLYGEADHEHSSENEA